VYGFGRRGRPAAAANRTRPKARPGRGPSLNAAHCSTAHDQAHAQSTPPSTSTSTGSTTRPLGSFLLPDLPTVRLTHCCHSSYTSVPPCSRLKNSCYSSSYSSSAKSYHHHQFIVDRRGSDLLCSRTQLGTPVHQPLQSASCCLGSQRVRLVTIPSIRRISTTVDQFCPCDRWLGAGSTSDHEGCSAPRLMAQ
jgi:hypothetical protein